jgi:hypothetical protein
VAWLSFKQFFHLVLELLCSTVVALESHAEIEHLPVLDEEFLEQALVIANLFQQAKVEDLYHQLHVLEHLCLMRLQLD